MAPAPSRRLPRGVSGVRPAYRAGDDHLLDLRGAFIDPQVEHWRQGTGVNGRVIVCTPLQALSTVITSPHFINPSVQLKSIYDSPQVRPHGSDGCCAFAAKA